MDILGFWSLADKTKGAFSIGNVLRQSWISISDLLPHPELGYTFDADESTRSATVTVII